MGTNWAFACSASSHKALDKIRSLKPKHIKERPFSLVCNDITMASSVGNIDNQIYRYLKKAWPGPFTVIVNRNRTLPKQIKDKSPVVGIRIPNEEITLEVINYFGKPLAVSSIPSEDGEQHLKWVTKLKINLVMQLILLSIWVKNYQVKNPQSLMRPMIR